VNTVSTEEKLGGVYPAESDQSQSVQMGQPGEIRQDASGILRAGGRGAEVGGGGGGPELCETNPAVLDIVAEGVLKDLDANPKLRNISVSQNDNDPVIAIAQRASESISGKARRWDRIWPLSTRWRSG